MRLEGPLEAIWANPQLKQVHLKLFVFARTMSRSLLNISKDEDCTTSLGRESNMFQLPTQSEIVSYVQTELPVFHFVPIASCPVTGYNWKESGSVVFTHTQTFRYLFCYPTYVLTALQSQPKPIRNYHIWRTSIIFNMYNMRNVSYS